MKKRKITFGILFLVLGLASAVAAYLLNIGKSTFAKAEWYVYLLYILGAFLLFIAFGYLYRAFAKEHKKITIKQLTLVGVMASITILLYYFAKFNIPFFPSWLDIQVSEIPALITSFMYGPLTGALIIVIRFFVKLPGTMTLGVGEIADLLLGVILVIISGSIYQKNRTLKGAIFGLVLGIIVATISAAVLNWLVLIPAFINIAGFNYDMLIGGMSYIPNLTKENFMLYYIFIGVVPFNLFRYLIIFVLTFALYKRIHILFNKIAPVSKEINEDN